MHSVRVILSLVVFCAVSSLNHGLPQPTPTEIPVDQHTTGRAPNDIIIGNEDDVLSPATISQSPDEGQSPQPNATPSSSPLDNINHTSQVTYSPNSDNIHNTTEDEERSAALSTNGDDDDDAGKEVTMTTKEDAEAVDAFKDTDGGDDDDIPHRLTENTDDSSHDGPSSGIHGTGFPWWSLLIILGVTAVIVVVISAVFYRYNQRIDEQRDAIKKDKRASELIVDSWMAASISSTGDSDNDDDYDGGRDHDTVMPMVIPIQHGVEDGGEV